jgi:ubiquitin-protein ligase
MQKRLVKERALLDPYTLEEEEANCWKLRTPNNWLIEFKFPTLYPFHAPTIRILEPTDLLPRLGICGCTNGIVCISGLFGDWGPSWTVQRALEHLEHTMNARTHNPQT